MMDKNFSIFILNHNGLTKGIAFETASECLWGRDSRD